MVKNIVRAKKLVGECCPIPVKKLKVSSQHVAAFKALSHPGRLQVFYHLVYSQAALPVHQVKSALQIPAPTLSHHLDHLERAGLISRRKQDRYIFSEVRSDLVIDLVRVLTACC